MRRRPAHPSASTTSSGSRRTVSGVWVIMLTKRLYTRWISSTPPLLAAALERLQQRPGDLLREAELRRVGVTRPLGFALDATELEEADGLAADEVVRRPPCPATRSSVRQLEPLAQDLRVERAGETAVGGEDHDRGALDRLALGGQRVVDVGVRRDRRDGARHGARERRRRAHARHRLLNARSRDELHRLRDLLGRLSSADLLLVDPELCAHSRCLPPRYLRRPLTIFSWLTSSASAASNSSRPGSSMR